MNNQTNAGTERSTTDRMKEKIGDATETVQETASHVAAEAREKSDHLIEEGREKVHELGDRAGVMARSRADQEKARLTNGIRTFADALRRGSDDLSGDRSQYRPLLNGAADRVESVSRYLEVRDIDTLTTDVRRFAREYTPLFVGGAFALGFAGARFLKSSGEEAARSRALSQSDYLGTDRYDRMLPESGTIESRTGPAGFENRGGFGTGTSSTGFQAGTTGTGNIGRTDEVGRGGDISRSTARDDVGGTAGGTYE